MKEKKKKNGINNNSLHNYNLIAKCYIRNNLKCNNQFF